MRKPVTGLLTLLLLIGLIPATTAQAVPVPDPTEAPDAPDPGDDADRARGLADHYEPSPDQDADPIVQHLNNPPSAGQADRANTTENATRFQQDTVAGASNGADFDGDGTGATDHDPVAILQPEIDAIDTMIGEFETNTTENRQRAAENATDVVNYLAAGATNGGDFDGDGQGPQPGNPSTIWSETEDINATRDRTVANLTAIAGDELDNATAVGGDVASGVANGGDLDDDGESPLDGATGAFQETLDDASALNAGVEELAGNLTGLPGQGITGVTDGAIGRDADSTARSFDPLVGWMTDPSPAQDAASNVQSEPLVQDVSNGNLDRFTDNASATAARWDTWARSTAGWSADGGEAMYDWTKWWTGTTGSTANETVHDVVNPARGFVNESLDTWCPWAGLAGSGAESTCKSLKQDPFSLLGPDWVLEQAFSQVDPVAGTAFDTLRNLPAP